MDQEQASKNGGIRGDWAVRGRIWFFDELDRELSQG